MAGIRFITDPNAEVYVSVKGENPRSLQRTLFTERALCSLSRNIDETATN